jgi:predicted ATPase
LVVHEDVHWIDPTTQELLSLAIERTQRLPVLTIITFRPEFTPPWAGQPHVSALALTRLGRREGTAMVDRVVGAKALPVEVSAQIVAKTDGVPLFVEELTKAVLESGLLSDAGDRYELAGPLPPLAIPATLQESLLARLDRLAPVKEVAQIGAALGREFSQALLAAVTERPEDQLRSALDQLVASELVLRRGTPPDAIYSFKHSMVQDVAYQSLLRSKREQLHARIARVLEERFPETAITQPKLLAHHCVQAGLMEQAVDYWIKAGQLSLARSATLEAVAQLSGGLKALRSLPESPEGYRRELDLQVALGRAQLAAKGWAAPETGEAYKRARELCERLGETRQLFPVLWGLTVFHINRGEPRTGYAVAEEMLRLAKRQDAAVQVASHRALSAALYHLGEFARTRLQLERVLALYEVQLDRPPPSLYASDHRVMALSFLPPTLLILGYADQARARHRDALAYARDVGHPHSLALALDHAFQFHCLAHEWEAAHAQAQALVELSTEQGFSHYRARGTLYRGCALAASGQTREGFALCQQAFAVWRDTGANVMTLVLGLQAEAHRKASRPKEALHLLVQALERVEQTDERWYEAELHRRQGDVLLSLRSRDQAEAKAPKEAKALLDELS